MSKLERESWNAPLLRGPLLDWYAAHRRDLPWRNNKDPYSIWVSEIMLQQTRVAVVIDRYQSFLARFPTIVALALAPEQDVLALWSGLGYYRRARMLHRCAQEVTQKHSGTFPRNSKALLELPGIGRYTAAAIASIAFAEPVAVVDGNVQRVLQRLIGITMIGITMTGINLNAAQTWQSAQALLDKARPGDFNQAMMELGAIVCVPRAPRCLTCPVRKWCGTRGEVGRAQGIEPTPASRQNKKQIWCALDWRNGGGSSGGNGTGKGCGNREVRLVQRSRKASLMPGMWELPHSLEPPLSGASARWRTFRHSITVTDYTVHVLRNMSPPAIPAAAKGKWIAIDRISQIPITGLTRKILKAGGII